MQCRQGGERRYPRHRQEVQLLQQGGHTGRRLCTISPTASPAASVSALFQGKGRCSPATQILSYYLKTHPNTGETKNVAIKRFVFTESIFSDILQENPGPAHYSWEQWLLGQVCTAWVHVHIWFTHDYTDWPLIHSFTLFPPDAHPQTIFLLNQLARKKSFFHLQKFLCSPSNKSTQLSLRSDTAKQRIR